METKKWGRDEDENEIILHWILTALSTSRGSIIEYWSPESVWYSAPVLFLLIVK
jgi:hypothetical protein